MGNALAGKVALVTGSARGMGAAEVRLFAAEGARVVVSDVLHDLGESVARDIGEQAIYQPLDVGDEDSWAEAIDRVLVAWGRIDVLINNAGIFRYSPLLEHTVDDYLAVFRTNELGTFLGIRTAGQVMTQQAGGSIVNVSSNGGVNGAPFLASYTASKFAVRGLTHVAAQELGPEVRVNTLVPGGIRTPLSHSDEFGAGEGVDDAVASVTPLRRIGLPEEVAQAALFLASDASSYCTGVELVVDGGLLAGGGTAAMSRSVLGVGHLATR